VADVAVAEAEAAQAADAAQQAAQAAQDAEAAAARLIVAERERATIEAAESLAANEQRIEETQDQTVWLTEQVTAHGAALGALASSVTELQAGMTELLLRTSPRSTQQVSDPDPEPEPVTQEPEATETPAEDSEPPAPPKRHRPRI
jgi:hypothetical protein